MTKHSPPLLNQCLYFLVDCVSRAVTEQTEKSLEPFNLKPREFLVLVTLQNGPLSQNKIADAVRVNVNRMTKLVDSLEQLGAVTRGKNPTNRREHCITLTPNGKKLVAEAGDALENAYEPLLEYLEFEEEYVFRNMLRRMPLEHVPLLTAEASEND